MPIDLDREEIITLAYATRYCAKTRNGRKPHSSTLYRWAVHGCRGIHLETLGTPGGLVTTKEALERFFVQIRQTRYPNLPQLQQGMTDRQHEAIEAELKRRFQI
jgi:hypothetical protein